MKTAKDPRGMSTVSYFKKNQKPEKYFNPLITHDEAYKLLNRIRKLTKDRDLPQHKLDERSAIIFNLTQEFLMSKGLI